LKPASQSDWFNAVTDTWQAVNDARIALLLGAEWDQPRPEALRVRLIEALDKFSEAVGMPPIT